MTQHMALLWLVLGCLVWVGIGAAMMQAWGDRDAYLRDLFEQLPQARALAQARPRLFSAIFLVSLAAMCVAWPWSQNNAVTRFPRRARCRWRRWKAARAEKGSGER